MSMNTEEKVDFILRELAAGRSPTEVAFDSRLRTHVPETIEMIAIAARRPVPGPKSPSLKRKSAKRKVTRRAKR